MKLWIVCCVILFGAFELYQWICRVSWFADVQLSLPVAVAGGIVLAIASNYDLSSGLPFNASIEGAAQPDSQKANQPIPLQTATLPKEPCKQPISFQLLTPPKRSISFEIRKPSNRGDGR